MPIRLRNDQMHGFGLGLRTEHCADFGPHRPPGVDWLKTIRENLPGGKPLHHLECIRADFPLLVHGVPLSVGGTDALDGDCLRDLRALAHRVQPAWVSDHPCWTGVSGRNLHDLLPLPLTEAALRHVAGRVSRVQDALVRRRVPDNVPRYVRALCRRRDGRA